MLLLLLRKLRLCRESTIRRGFGEKGNACGSRTVGDGSTNGLTKVRRGGVAKIKGTGKTRRRGAHDGLTSFSVHRNLVPPFTILSMTCQFMVPQQ